MADLPADIFLHVFSHLDLPELCKLSLVNRNFRWLACTYKFRNVQLRFTLPHELSLAILKSRRILRNAESLKHVHHLELLPAEMPAMDEGIGDFLPAGGRVGAHPIEPWRYTKNDAATAARIPANSHGWHDLANFVVSLKALRDLTWACGEQLPIRILREIETRQPICRLHMRSLRTSNIYFEANQPVQITSEDLEVAASPCLYSISTMHDAGAQVSLERYIYEVVTTGAAINLQEVNQACCVPPPGSSAVLEWMNLQPLEQQPDSVRHLNPPRQYSLKALRLQGDFTMDRLKAWHEITDFTVLQRLIIYDIYARSDFRWLAAHCSFPALKELATLADDIRELEAFVISLPPLVSLQFKVLDEVQSLETILKHCGVHLRSLQCCGVFAEAELITQLRNHCPRLEDLGLDMYRRAGSAKEVSEYEALGSLPALRRIGLSFYKGPQLRTTEDELPMTLKSFAIDETLARSIFSKVSRSKPTNARPLERLQLRVADQVLIDVLIDLIGVIKYTSRSWICTSNAQTRNECSAQPWYPEGVDEQFNEHQRAEMNEVLKGPLASKIISLWPESCNGDLASVWHSFPLYPELEDEQSGA